MNLNNIIAHRGFWKVESEKNTMLALTRAVENGFGFETDFRDYGERVLISHDPPRGIELTAEDVFQMYESHNCEKTLALNIKADGLQGMMKSMLKKYNIKNYFVFDMSVCDTIPYIEENITIASRKSEYEVEMPFLEKSEFVWIDYFNNDIDIKEIKRFLLKGKKVCVVSPELHKRSRQVCWNFLKSIDDDALFLCTDEPDKATEYFK